ncbi:1-deoxy-D-xylulose-5-phosphate reductoisomerase [Spiroplasma endosymbiont of Anurida maritima]|uniref:hypothetical protein n=1 Tax=Spiroplasma endosymbiont of Anurida maritima TaxID=2967972 RepID=UPI0036D3829B
MKRQKVCILGVSGSVGKQTLEVVENNSEHFVLNAISFWKNIDFFKKINKNHLNLKYVYCSSAVKKK